MEIRTSPKAYENSTYYQYIEAVVEEVKECEKLYPSCKVRVLVSVNRGKGIEYSKDVFEVTKRFIVEDKNPYVVGLDFSGNPGTNCFDDFKDHVFTPARELGIKMTFHISEIKGVDAETD